VCDTKNWTIENIYYPMNTIENIYYLDIEIEIILWKLYVDFGKKVVIFVLPYCAIEDHYDGMQGLRLPITHFKS